MKIVENGNCGKWKLWEMEIKVNGNCGKWKIVENVNCGK